MHTALVPYMVATGIDHSYHKDGDEKLRQYNERDMRSYFQDGWSIATSSTAPCTDPDYPHRAILWVVWIKAE